MDLQAGCDIAAFWIARRLGTCRVDLSAWSDVRSLPAAERFSSGSPES